MTAAGRETRPGSGSALLAHLRARRWQSVLALILLGVLVLTLVWDWNWFRGPIERQVEARTGRSFQIGGDLDVDIDFDLRALISEAPTLRTTIEAGQLEFGNADWSEQPLMASAEHVAFDIELLPLLAGDVRIPELHLQRPRLHLEAGPEGRGNWVFGEPGDGEGPQFRRLWVESGALRFLDTAGDTDILIGVATTASDDTDGNATSPPIIATGGGRWRGNSFTIEGRAASPLGLQDTESPYRIDVRASAGATRARARGTLLDPLRLRDFDLQLELAGQNLADLYPLLGIALPDTPPYDLEGHFTRDGATWHYDDFSGRVGDSDLAGDASVDTGGARPYLRADLVSKRLDFDDLAGFVGGAPQAGDGESSNPELAAQATREAGSARVLPDTPYQLDKLRAMDADVRLRAQRINAPSLPLDDMDAHLLLEDGLLRLDPLNFGVAGGEIRSTVRMDARKDTIVTGADIAARGLDLSKLMPTVELADNAIGQVSGNVDLQGTGNSVAAMLGSSDGDVAVGMGQGKISNLLMEMAGIDLAEIIKYKLAGDRLIPVRCAFGDFAVSDGVMRTRALAFDTTDTILVGEGTIDLGEEQLDLTIRPRPKDRSLLALRTPLHVSGTFKDPSVRPDLGRLGLRGAIALTLGSIAPPAALLATLELGPGENASCGGQYAE